MSQLLVRDLDVSTVSALKKLAAEHHRSLQSEVKCILERAASHVRHNQAQLASKIRKKIKFGLQSDSAKLIAEDRKR